MNNILKRAQEYANATNNGVLNDAYILDAIEDIYHITIKRGSIDMKGLTYDQIESFLQDLMGSYYMKIPIEDVLKYHTKVRKFIKEVE